VRWGSFFENRRGSRQAAFRDAPGSSQLWRCRRTAQFDPKLPFAGASTTGGAPTFRGGFEVIRGKGVPSNTDTNANDRRLNEALEPVSGAAARALRDSTRRGFIRRDAHFPGMPYSRDSAATRSENCGVKYRYQRRCVVDRFHFGASARNAANSVAACSLRPASA